MLRRAVAVDFLAFPSLILLISMLFCCQDSCILGILLEILNWNQKMQVANSSLSGQLEMCNSSQSLPQSAGKKLEKNSLVSSRSLCSTFEILHPTLVACKQHTSVILLESETSINCHDRSNRISKEALQCDCSFFSDKCSDTCESPCKRTKHIEFTTCCSESTKSKSLLFRSSCDRERLRRLGFVNLNDTNMHENTTLSQRFAVSLLNLESTDTLSSLLAQDEDFATHDKIQTSHPATLPKINTLSNLNQRTQSQVDVFDNQFRNSQNQVQHLSDLPERHLVQQVVDQLQEPQLQEKDCNSTHSWHEHLPTNGFPVDILSASLQRSQKNFNDTQSMYHESNQNNSNHVTTMKSFLQDTAPIQTDSCHNDVQAQRDVRQRLHNPKCCVCGLRNVDVIIPGLAISATCHDCDQKIIQPHVPCNIKIKHRKAKTPISYRATRNYSVG